MAENNESTTEKQLAAPASPEEDVVNGEVQVEADEAPRREAEETSSPGETSVPAEESFDNERGDNIDRVEAEDLGDTRATNKDEQSAEKDSVAADNKQGSGPPEEDSKNSADPPAKKMSLGSMFGGGGGSGEKSSGFGGLVQKKKAAAAAAPEKKEKVPSPKNEDPTTLPETPMSAAVSGLYSDLGMGVDSVHVTSNRGATGNRSTFGEDVDALSVLLDSMYNEERRQGMSRRVEPPSGNGVMPYLDVMTVNSTQFPSSSDEGYFGNHTRLLIEPISFPSLKHTGVNSELLDRVAEEKVIPQMFYPNGTRKLSLRDSIRGLLKEGMEQGLYSPTRSLSGDISIDRMKGTPGGSRRSFRSSRSRDALRGTKRPSRLRNSSSRDTLGKSSLGDGKPGTRQRIGSRTRLRSRETQYVLDALHETLHKMDRAVMKA